ncbi:hypothetical protein OWR29_35125 [Actinoplanes sp. Pm04-4]|uniref:Uncharacterized protein n=1 Tax=Paractinoplanes pyxinae TaxID=2997416 RepID=A0ABT4B9S9_9ACTN|nr:hypothetical protein [Actinoplanes pyxinae]MCY1143257.1 hypothetical protein [Actinoplanes pyxinae]
MTDDSRIERSANVPQTEAAADPDNLRTAYEQLCSSYRAIDDFRAKLLGFLPLVTDGGLILLTGRSADMREEFFRPVGLFGLAVTAGLLAYEMFGIRKCHALVRAGQDLECALGLPVAGDPDHHGAGQFLRRPQSLLGVVNEPFAAATIYPAVLAAWTYLALYRVPGGLAARVSGTLFVAGFVLILVYDQLLKHDVIDEWARQFKNWRKRLLASL